MIRLVGAFLVSIFILNSNPAFANGHNPPQCRDVKCIQIGTFNIQWLGTKMRRITNNKLRSKKSIRQLARFVGKSLDLEVFGLQEINIDSPQFKLFAGILANNGYQFVAVDQGNQSVPIFFNTNRVRLVKDHGLLNSITSFKPQGCSSKNRVKRPHVADFKSGNFDFRIIVLHLKSQLGGSCSDKSRTAQAESIAKEIKQLPNTEKDLIVLGDFNAQLDDPSIGPLLNSRIPLTSNRFRSNRSGSLSYPWGQYRSLIDHILVYQSEASELLRGSTFIFNDPQGQAATNYRKYFSDHVPVWVSFKVEGRDDDWLSKS